MEGCSGTECSVQFGCPTLFCILGDPVVRIRPEGNGLPTYCDVRCLPHAFIRYLLFQDELWFVRCLQLLPVS